jgi:hypothetical protein
MDKSEGRGNTYDLVEFPSRHLHLDGGIRIGPVSAYYQPRALRDPGTGSPILLDCFNVTGTDLPSMSQAAMQRLVDNAVGGIADSEQKSAYLARECSLDMPLPADACKLEASSAPSRHSAIASSPEA